MKNIFIALLLLTTIGYSQSIERQVIGSTGTTLTDGATASIDFTVGELVVSTITDGTTILTQGFHQGEVLLSIKINPIVFLQGAGLSPNSGEESLMRDDIRVATLVPVISPYTDAVTCAASVLNTGGTSGTGAITDNIVDWVWVELRDATDSTAVVSSQSALLQRDGDIVATDGFSPMNFSVANGDYYVVVNHRNHLGVITANAVALSSTAASLDFTANTAYVLGGNLAVMQLTNGEYAMYGGDYNGDEQVLNTDIQSVTPLAGLSGYSPADADMNGTILNTDIQLVILPNTGKGQQF